MKDPRHSKQSRPVAWMALGLTTALAIGTFTACNKHVFRVVPADCVKEQQIARDLEADVPADILVVVDNSNSMCEEQDNLVENFFDPDCPIDISQPIPEEYINPPPEVVAQLSQECGFIQILSLFEKDFRLGVITTDVSQCDNAFNLAELPQYACGGEPRPDWGRKPQRGCLQPTAGGQKVLSNADVASGDIGDKFRSVLQNIRVYGSPFERGLDAVEVFLDPDSSRAPGCENDLDQFLRDDANLVVIFLTDEEDCSHADGAYAFPDENSEGDCSVPVERYYTQRTPSVAPEECYGRMDDLAPINRYVDFLRGLKGDDVSVAVIGGAVEENGAFEARGCSIDAATKAPTGECQPRWGQTNKTATGEDCPAPGEGVPCCMADSGSRYYQFARAFGAGNYLENSICFESFRSTMIDIASFIGRTDFVRLAEKPADPSAIIVKVTRNGADEEEILPRIPDGAPTDGQNGWQYDGNLEIHFYGTATPKPGDKLYVAALDTRETDGGAACIAPEFGDTGSSGDAGN